MQELLHSRELKALGSPLEPSRNQPATLCLQNLAVILSAHNHISACCYAAMTA